METTVRESKVALRRQVGAALARMPAAVRMTASAQARALLAEQHLWREARSILFYAPMSGELDVWPLMEAALGEGKLATLPRFATATKKYIACRVQDLAADVAPGWFGIREPLEQCEAVPLDRLDFVLVPGVAFDQRGYRLGRGKGFYDQLLAGIRGTTCGVAFDEQMVGAVPVEPHDIRLNCILTPTHWIRL
jgi:5-formyltetrahydrofolate cyclo-ligase